MFCKAIWQGRHLSPRVTKPVQSVLVTGASSGIGLALSKVLLQAEYAVIGLSRTIDKDTIEHPHFRALACDLRDNNAASSCIKQLVKETPSLSAAVFCAGVGYFGKLEQLKFSRIEDLIQLNLLSPILLTKLLLPHFKRQSKGRLIFLGSEAALQGAKNGTAYCASKFGLRGFVQSLSAESRQAGVNVSIVNPGMVNTPFFDDLNFKPGAHESNSISPQTIAQCIKNILEVDANTVIEEINLSPRNKVIAFKSQ